MGTICNGQQAPRQITSLPALNFDTESSNETTHNISQKNLKQKMNTMSMRFGDVQKMRASSVLQSNNYKFILPIRDSDEYIKIECPIISSYADQFSSIGLKILANDGSVKYDEQSVPIIDLADTSSDRQIYFKYKAKSIQPDKFSGEKQEDVTIKVYNYKNYYDPIFKNGLYEASIYKTLDSFANTTMYLKDFFLIEKGNLFSMVFVHGSYLCSLAQILAYRNQANFHYTVPEQTYIALQILKSYGILKLNNIIHRDIRPSKIFLYDSSNKKLSSRGLSFNGQSYFLSNLQTARKFTKAQLRELRKQGDQDNNQQMLMTVRGVPTMSSEQVKQLFINQSEIGVYDYQLNQRTQLAKTIASIVTLNPIQQSIKVNEIKRKNKAIGESIFKLLNSKQPISNIIDYLKKEIPNKSKLQTMQIMDKQKKLPESILRSDYEIATSYLPSLIKKLSKQRIQSSSTECMISLHRQDQFLKKYEKMMDINDTQGNQMNNVAILDRLGRYYQAIGIKNNDYYQEEVKMLMQICAKERQNGFITTPYLNQARGILDNKVPTNSLDSPTQISLFLQEAYDCLSESKDLEKAQAFINQAMIIGGKQNNLPVISQLDLIQAKTLVQLQANSGDQASQYAEKGLEMSKNRQNFMTQVQMLEYKSKFQYLLGLCYLKDCQASKRYSKSEELQRSMKKIDSLLNNARNTQSELPLRSVVPLGKTMEANADFLALKQNYIESAKSYERVYRLYTSSEKKVSEKLILGVLQKLYKIYQNNLEDLTEQSKVEERLQRYRKKFNKTRDPRENFQKIKYLTKKRAQNKQKVQEKKNLQFQEIQEQSENEQQMSEINNRSTQKRKRLSRNPEIVSMSNVHRMEINQD